MSEGFWQDSVEALAGDVRARRTRASELIERALARIAAADGTINAFCALDADGGRAQAAAIDARIAAGDEVGPLAGIPIGVKDLEDAAGFTTTYGSALRAGDPVATRDSVGFSIPKAAVCRTLPSRITATPAERSPRSTVPAAITASNAAALSGAVFCGGAVVVVVLVVLVLGGVVGRGLSRVGRPEDGGAATTPGEMEVGGMVAVEADSPVVVVAAAVGGVADVAADSSWQLDTVARAITANPAAPINQTRLGMRHILAAAPPRSAAARRCDPASTRRLLSTHGRPTDDHHSRQRSTE